MIQLSINDTAHQLDIQEKEDAILF